MRLSLSEAATRERQGQITNRVLRAVLFSISVLVLYPRRVEHLTICRYRVCTGPGILSWHFPGLESPGKRPLVLESSGNLLNSAKKCEVSGRQ